MNDERPGPIDPALYRRDGMRKVLTGWDITALYQALKDDAGLSQRQIAVRTGQQQSEVAEILSGRRGAVENHRVLRRIVGGLGVPPEMMGLSWCGPDGTDHRPATRLELARGRLDAAESFATASVRRWEGINNQRARTQSDVLLATVHVRAGERDGLGLAHGAITGVTKLSSVRVRRQGLTPLTVALEARPGGDAKQLARMARQVAVTRV